MGTWAAIKTGDISVTSAQYVIDNGTNIGVQYYEGHSYSRYEFWFLASENGLYVSGYPSTRYPGYFCLARYVVVESSIVYATSYKFNNGEPSYNSTDTVPSRTIPSNVSATTSSVYLSDTLPFIPFASYSEMIANLPSEPPVPEPVSVPITYYPTGCVLQGPSEAEQGDTVNVLVTPGPGKVIKPESIQVYNRSGLITHTYSSGILSFDVPE